LLDIFVRNLASFVWIEKASVNFLMHLFTLMPDQHDTAASLVKLSMITDFCFNVVISDPYGYIARISGIGALIDDNIWDWERSENFLEAVDTRLCETRQYDHLLFLGQVVNSQSPIHLLVIAVQSFACQNSYSAYNDISFQEQLVLLQSSLFNRLDLRRTFEQLKCRRDRLAYYRIMKASSHVSDTAASIAKHPFQTEWGDNDTSIEEAQHVAAQMKGYWAYEYISRLARILASCKAAFTELPPKRKMMFDGIVLAHDAFRECMTLLGSEVIPTKESLRKPLQATEKEAEMLLHLLERDPPGEEAANQYSWTACAVYMSSILVMARQLATEFPQLSTAVDISAISSAIVRLSYMDFIPDQSFVTLDPEEKSPQERSVVYSSEPGKSDVSKHRASGSNQEFGLRESRAELPEHVSTTISTLPMERSVGISTAATEATPSKRTVAPAEGVMVFDQTPSTLYHPGPGPSSLAGLGKEVAKPVLRQSILGNLGRRVSKALDRIGKREKQLVSKADAVKTPTTGNVAPKRRNDSSFPLPDPEREDDGITLRSIQPQDPALV
jgi:hypothetical protein